MRGLVDQITDLEAYINTRGFLDYLFSLGPSKGGAQNQDTVCVAGDLRPSTNSKERSILRAVAHAITDSGLQVQYLGNIPTPALACYAMLGEHPSVMVTGSHIPHDRNGIKFCKGNGEVLKPDEAEILKAVANMRHREYESPASQSIFDRYGMIRAEEQIDLPAADPAGEREYIRRYVDFFEPGGLRGFKIVLYQHSAVGRDILAEILTRLGASVYAAGRSDAFIPIDTEDIQESQLQTLQALVRKQSELHGPMDVLLSTDGDSDRPLIVALDHGTARFIRGDLVGLAAAIYLKANAAAVPISTNDAVEMEFAKRNIPLIKTKIGSPYVIQAMEDARARLGPHKRIVAWEANGGFLTCTDLEIAGRKLHALPTRDAVLPILCILYSAAEQNISLAELVSRLPSRAGKAGLIDRFPVETSHRILAGLSPADAQVVEAEFRDSQFVVRRKDGSEISPARTDPIARELAGKKRILESYFTESDGFPEVIQINFQDGVRVYFRNGDIAHLRPSGNAPQMRVYANSDSEERAAAIVRLALAEPDGILRRIERDSAI